LDDGTGNDIVYSKTSDNTNLGFGFRRVSIGSSGSYLRVTGTETLTDDTSKFTNSWVGNVPESMRSANRNYF